MALTISATDTELPKPLNAVFQQTLLRNAQVRAPYMLGTVSGELTKQRGSNVVMWRRIENLSAATTALSELTTTASYMQGRDAAALSVTNVTATASKYGNFVILNEEVDLFNFPGQFDKIMQVIGINSGQSINQLQRNIGEDNLTLIYAGGAASDGAVSSIITANSIKLAINTIDKLSAMTFTPMTTGSTNIGTVPILSAYWGLCHPDVAVDIAGLTGFTSIEQYAGQVATVMGEFGTLGIAGKAVRFVSSEDASAEAGLGASGATSNGLNGTSDNADLYTTLIYGQDCLASVGLGTQYDDGVFRAGADLDPVDVIVKAPSATGTSDPFNEISTVAWKAWHTGAVLNPNWGRGIRSAATLLTA
jgi:N4-gp56 family major capsid protein